MKLSGAQYSNSRTTAIIVEGRGQVQLRRCAQQLCARRGVQVPVGATCCTPPGPNRIPNGRYEFDGATYRLLGREPAAGNAIHRLIPAGGAHRQEAPHGVGHNATSCVAGLWFRAPRLGVEYSLRYRRADRFAQPPTLSSARYSSRPPPVHCGPDRYASTISYSMPATQNRCARTAARHLPRWTRLVAAGRRRDTVWADTPGTYVQLFTGDRPDVGRRGSPPSNR